MNRVKLELRAARLTLAQFQLIVRLEDRHLIKLTVEYRPAGMVAGVMVSEAFVISRVTRNPRRRAAGDAAPAVYREIFGTGDTFDKALEQASAALGRTYALLTQRRTA